MIEAERAEPGKRITVDLDRDMRRRIC